MLKKLKRRFIAAAMGAFSAVTLILLLTVNIWNCNINASRQDSTLEMLIELESRQQNEPPKSGPPVGASSENSPSDNTRSEDWGDFPIPGPFGGHSREARYMTRFFLVYCGENGNVTEIDKEHIASITDEEAESYALDVLKKGIETGYYKNYRCKVVRSGENGIIVAFLNSEREIQSIKTLFLVSGVIALCSLTAVFVLVLLLSGRAIAPYVRNM